MATTRTRKTKRKGSAARHNVTITFLDKKNPRGKPSISSAKTRQLLTEIEAFSEREGTAQTQGCTTEGCGGVVRGVKGIAADFGVALSCSYSCRWFYSTGGGWQKECYFRCHDSSRRITIEGTGR